MTHQEVEIDEDGYITNCYFLDDLLNLWENSKATISDKHLAVFKKSMERAIEGQRGGIEMLRQSVLSSGAHPNSQAARMVAEFDKCVEVLEYAKRRRLN